MKISRIIIPIICILLVIGYSFKSSKVRVGSKECINYNCINYCIEKSPHLDYNMTNERIELVHKIYDIFGNDSCTDVNFTIPFSYKEDTILLPFVCYVDCHGCSNQKKENNICTILINKDDLILFESSFIEKDSIDRFVTNFYDQYYSNDKIQYEHFDIYIGWDYGLTQKQIDKFIIEILHGYVNFLKSYSTEVIGKPFSELSKTERCDIMKKYKLRFRTAFFGSFKNGNYIERKS